MAARLFGQHLKTTNIGLLNDVAPGTLGEPNGTFGDVIKSDVMVLAGADPAKDQPVSSFLVKRVIDAGGRLIVIGGEENGLAPFAHMCLDEKDIGQAVEIAERAENPAVLYGACLTEKAAEALNQLQGKACFIALEPGANTRAAKGFGLAGAFCLSGIEALYLLIGEQKWEGADLLPKLDKGTFVVAQASFASPATRRADVVLPMAIWSERSGTLTNTEGRVLTANKAVDPAGEAKPDWEILALLADRLGIKIGTSLNEITVQATRERT